VRGILPGWAKVCKQTGRTKRRGRPIPIPIPTCLPSAQKRIREEKPTLLAQAQAGERTQSGEGNERVADQVVAGVGAVQDAKRDSFHSRLLTQLSHPLKRIAHQAAPGCLGASLAFRAPGGDSLAVRRDCRCGSALVVPRTLLAFV